MGGLKAALHRRMATGGVCCGKDLHIPQRRNRKPGPGALALHLLICLPQKRSLHCALQMPLAGKLLVATSTVAVARNPASHADMAL